jgi:prepilin-type N-terminal cleavage/methylation domain-containing protein/prepilin-type processing-associated H-X9-DG protein
MCLALRSSMSRRSAFTLLELLVVIAILALLMALGATAIQRVRAAAARLACLSQLRQMGMAVHGYADAHQEFPAGCDKRPNSLPAGGGKVHISWQTKLLPFIEQDSLWREVLDAYRNDPSGDSVQHEHVQSIAVALFRCPADARTVGWIFPEYPWGLTAYQTVAGTSVEYQDGLFHENVSYRFADVTDGTSNTLMIGERTPGPQGTWSGWYGHWGDNPCLLAQVLGAANNHGLPDKAANCQAPINEFRSGGVDNLCDVVHFWSLHAGGANFAFADGSARFIPYSFAILPDLATRTGGEAVSLDW